MNKWKQFFEMLLRLSILLWGIFFFIRIDNRSEALNPVS